MFLLFLRPRGRGVDDTTGARAVGPLSRTMTAGWADRHGGRIDHNRCTSTIASSAGLVRPSLASRRPEPVLPSPLRSTSPGLARRDRRIDDKRPSVRRSKIRSRYVHVWRPPPRRRTTRSSNRICANGVILGARRTAVRVVLVATIPAFVATDRSQRRHDDPGTLTPPNEIGFSLLTVTPRSVGGGEGSVDDNSPCFAPFQLSRHWGRQPRLRTA